jgi:ribosomal protein S18 acetylase RimI-like enzyme
MLPFFEPPVKTVPSHGDPTALLEASHFFVDAFWTNKIGGGAKQLTSSQRQSLLQTQQLEFRKRYYVLSSKNREAELILCRAKVGTANQIVGCVGLEIDRIPSNRLNGMTLKRAPLMSNVAVATSYRRRGVAKLLVRAAEDLARVEWGFDEMYLYVEQRNVPAVRLYQKMGYQRFWQDNTATTLLPTAKGTLSSEPTTILCMKKKLRPRNPFFPFL